MVRNSPLPLGFAAFVGAGLLVERDAGSFGELALGILTWLVLLAACRRLDRDERRRVTALVAVASAGEVLGSLILQLYAYRRGGIPLFVPPGHRAQCPQEAALPQPSAGGSLRGPLARWRRSAERRPSVSRPRAARSSIPSTAATSSTRQPAMRTSATASRSGRRHRGEGGCRGAPDRVEMLDDHGMRPYGAPRAVSSTERLSQAS